MSPSRPKTADASIRREEAADGALRLVLRGRLDADTTGRLWRRAVALLDEAAPGRAVVDASGVDYCDGAGIALLLELRRRQEARGGELSVEGLAEEFRRSLDRFEGAELDPDAYRRSERWHPVERAGRVAQDLAADARRQVEFVGELLVSTADALLHPGSVRWKEVFVLIERVGADALPIVALIGFLMGLIMAFEAAIILKQFGGEVFIARFIGLSLIRELGPLVTAIVLAGRSGSSFAAELGTMQVNDEISALRTMGLDPVRVLVVNRVVAAVAIMPPLTVFFDLAGLVGGAFVAFSLGIPLVSYANQALDSVGLADVIGAVVKALVLGLLVAAAGCLRGLQTERSASGVGRATTRAVVSGIVLIAVASGVFAVVYYYLGI
jgi:phospholipid/cholesterol/gamma-HCH transport system permease protein